MNLDTAVHFESLFGLCRTNADEISVVKDLRVTAFRDIAEANEKILCPFQLDEIFTITA